MSTVQHFARPPSCLSYMASLSISEAVGKIMGGAQEGIYHKWASVKLYILIG